MPALTQVFNLLFREDWCISHAAWLALINRQLITFLSARADFAQVVKVYRIRTSSSFGHDQDLHQFTSEQLKPWSFS